MKNALVCFALAAGALAAPALSFAQSNAPVTRAEVRADLIRVEQAGYSPATGDDSTYPAGIQAAEAKIAAQDVPQATQAVQAPQASQADYGGVTQNVGASGKPNVMPMGSTCVGPVSYCDIFFGS
ncbi:DUF4148 domain-containing protein [Paraburkholderia sp. BCC1884]|uniref:DUF4148 domain-containing protein n=1 Tax=Paraburkholderia sp. BCC1884 TaxID=2562668 RepID=UPI0011830B40|nr:DUF4148 domain-containing protein [Paraburkholderia sp. BCC1884]